MKVFKAGEIIACPGCGVYIAECTRAFYGGDLLTRSHFKPLDGHEIGPGLNCKTCGEYYGRRKVDYGMRLQLHTVKGWRPELK